MGSKNAPGKFDCYANAEPDEPMFVLLGRDRDAPALVELWAMLRERAGEDPAKVAEARDCAQRMKAFGEYRRARTSKPHDISPHTEVDAAGIAAVSDVFARARAAAVPLLNEDMADEEGP